MSGTRYRPDRLVATLDAILRRSGSSAEEAATVAANLVEADARGHASHGVCQIAVYARSLELGHLQPDRHARIVRDEAPFLVVDGDVGYGQVIAKEATDLAIERAKAGGACILALRNAHHIGRVGSYGEQCIAAGLIGLYFVNVVSRPLAAPHGGGRPRLGTNPVCIAVPGTPGYAPFLLDFATSAIAANKCRIKASLGKEVEDGLLLDPEGRPTRDPGVMFTDPTGAILPFGGHKGYGLALACEILAGALAGGLPALPENLRPGRVVNNALAFVIDPNRVAGPEWQTLTDAVLDHVADTPPIPGGSGVSIPGEPEALHRIAAMDRGIALDPDTVAALHRIGGGLGLDVPALLEG
ncbi:malate/lactate/ureidoglycolate dehydrogenase [Azospirillum sp. YIM B02556]|uniref:Malate/lactate/ureidoglycolate dehydrogenase n=1 Tax=Azospirillum endophyticum TaxID=2800326 RepID=A0ABS1FAX9_9PROT|nr:malate/lactate/ureidoglycolate dehydrogenase [Azospirillum endophyticum]MBK1840584.1 malate/lactate/ureidoglycolate dehydrogenase [Azospirillum endophyticum]